MNAQILFHPQLKLIDAARIARNLGGDVVFRAGRVRIRMAMLHTDQAAAAIEVEDYEAALVSLRAAHKAFFGGVKPCTA